MTSGTFTFIVDGKLITYDDYTKIPTVFEHVIKFLPDIPAGPHTAEQHASIDMWNERFQRLMHYERTGEYDASSN